MKRCFLCNIKTHNTDGVCNRCYYREVEDPLFQEYKEIVRNIKNYPRPQIDERRDDSAS